MRLCEIDGCEERHRARWLCRLHYQRWVKHGDLLTVLPAFPDHQDMTRAQIKAVSEAVEIEARKRFFIAWLWLALDADRKSA